MEDYQLLGKGRDLGEELSDQGQEMDVRAS